MRRTSWIAVTGTGRNDRRTRRWKRYEAISRLGIKWCIALKRRDADLKGYFDSIPHAELLTCIRARIADRTVVKLIRMWLQAPVVEPPEEKGGAGKWSRSEKGTPQGGVVSALLANLYLHWFDALFHGPDGPARSGEAKLVRYADDSAPRARRAEKGPMCVTA